MSNEGLKTFVVTTNGSTTLYTKHFNSITTPCHEAVVESQLVYIKNGLSWWLELYSENCTVLEVGFGTGLNVFLPWSLLIKLEEKFAMSPLKNTPFYRSK
jgi:tRNA U34 5-methylaminomethyl-2-thiouridine-forming methyltransferase MnmC